MRVTCVGCCLFWRRSRDRPAESPVVGRCAGAADLAGFGSDRHAVRLRSSGAARAGGDRRRSAERPSFHLPIAWRNPRIWRCAAQWVAVRALREPDAIPSLDPDLAQALGVASASEVEERSEAWRPWRAYAAIYLWRFGHGISAREDASARPATKKSDASWPVIDQQPSDFSVEV